MTPKPRLPSESIRTRELLKAKGFEGREEEGLEHLQLIGALKAARSNFRFSTRKSKGVALEEALRKTSSSTGVPVSVLRSHFKGSQPLSNHELESLASELRHEFRDRKPVALPELDPESKALLDDLKFVYANKPPLQVRQRFHLVRKALLSHLTRQFLGKNPQVRIRQLHSVLWQSLGNRRGKASFKDFIGKVKHPGDARVPVALGVLRDARNPVQLEARAKRQYLERHNRVPWNPSPEQLRVLAEVREICAGLKHAARNVKNPETGKRVPNPKRRDVEKQLSEKVAELIKLRPADAKLPGFRTVLQEETGLSDKTLRNVLRPVVVGLYKSAWEERLSKGRKEKAGEGSPPS
ncbi:MAG TPA: hypothetical protein VJA40_03595 [archaeon]|nr:hypothetical protein [archaeon]